MQEDGGGWIEIANIGDNMRKMQIYKDKYQKGYQATNIDGEHIFPCSAFDGLDGGEGDLSELKSQIMNDPENTDLKFKLAEKYLLTNETEMGFNELLKIFEKKPKWNDEAAKKKLLE